MHTTPATSQVAVCSAHRLLAITGLLLAVAMSIVLTAAGAGAIVGVALVAAAAFGLGRRAHHVHPIFAHR